MGDVSVEEQVFTIGVWKNLMEISSPSGKSKQHKKLQHNYLGYVHSWSDSSYLSTLKTGCIGLTGWDSNTASLQSAKTSANDFSEVWSLLSASPDVQRNEPQSNRQAKSRTVSSRKEIWNGTEDRIIIFLMVSFSTLFFSFLPGHWTTQQASVNSKQSKWHTKQRTEHFLAVLLWKVTKIFTGCSVEQECAFRIPHSLLQGRWN